MKAPRPTRRALAAAALAAAWLLACAAEARACVCGQTTPCEALGAADAVFVGTVSAQREAEEEWKEEGLPPVMLRLQISRFNVEEAFAGLGGAAEVEIETELSTSCAFPLSVGARYLVYAHRGEGERAGRLSTAMCSRTGRVEHVAEDLEYLRDAAARAGAALEGAVTYEGARADPAGPAPGADTVGVTTVVAEGGGLRAEARVGHGGKYQFKGLRPGKYRVTVPLPDELTVRDPYTPEIAAELGVGDQREVEVPARGCVVRDIVVVDNGRISGRVTDAEGEPVAGLRVGLRRVREAGAGAQEEAEEPSATTDEDGRYLFKGLPAGRYLIGVRVGSYLSPGEAAAAFRRTFYPGVPNEREAVAVSLGRGQSVTRRDFQLGPRLRERTVSGVVLHADGRPAAGATVRYQARTRDRKDSALVFLRADGRGRFSFKGYEGTSFLVGAFTEECAPAKCLHAHEVEVGPAGAPRPLRLVLDQPDKSCDRCRDYDEFASEGKP